MWTLEQRKIFGTTLVLTAKLYDRDLDRDVARLVIGDLQDLDFQECLNALDAFRKNPKNKTWPRAADIRSMVKQELDDETKGRLAAARALEAVSKFGYSNPVEAKEYIGELGWKAIQRFGGWTYVCENLGVDINITSFQAQIRDIAIATQKAAFLGFEDKPIGIEKSENRQTGLQKIDPLKLIGANNETEPVSQD